MKKIYLILMASLLGLGASAQDLQLPRLSPQTKVYLDAVQQQHQAPLNAYVYKRRADGSRCISALVKVNPAAKAQVDEALKGINASVGTRAGSVWTVQVPVTQVSRFTTLRGIDYIQLDEPMVFPAMDNTARKTTRVDSVHGGYSLPIPYSGKDVIAGIIDFGFDYTHPTMYDTNGTRYRVLKVWEMNTTGTPPAGYSYGHELTDTNLIKAQGTDNPVQMHGAGVAGLMAGSGFGSGGAYRGAAYDAEMILAGVRRDSIEGQWFSGGFSDFIDAAAYIFEQGKAYGKPVVLNISWGSQSGPHDGSSLVNQAFDTLSGPGRIIVMSGGNDGQDDIFLTKTFSASDTAVKTFLRFSSNVYKRTWIDIWGDTAKTFCTEVALYRGNTTGRICIDDLSHDYELVAADGMDTCYVKVISSSSEYNMKPRITLDIYNKSNDSVSITVSGTSGKVNMWNEYYYYGYNYGYSSVFHSNYQTGYVFGSTSTTVSDMGAAKSTLLIGAYTSKLSFVDVNGIPRSFPGLVGRISNFSSKGPLTDGRVKPDITAPGLVITTSMNSFDTAYSATGSRSYMVSGKYTAPVSGKDYYFGEFSGTSAAAPIASGIIAMLLQIDPTLTPERVRDILARTAIRDSYTGSLSSGPSNTWGYGKINAYGAVRELVRETNISTSQGSRLDCVLFPNPSDGQVLLDYIGSSNEQLRISVLDMNGRQVWAETWQVQSGNNRKALDLRAVAKGMYLVHVSSSTGSISIKAALR